MKEILNAVLGMLLCISLTVGFLPSVAFAQEKPEFSNDEVSLAVTADDSTIIDERWFRIENPLYKGSGKAEETSPQSTNALALLSAEEETTYVSYGEAVGIITEAMANRQETISVSLETDKNYASLSSSMFYDAMEEDGNPEHGDYLRWIWGTVNFGMTGTGNASTGVYKITYTYAIEYFTTATQEQQLMARVDEVLGGMNLNGKSDYEKTKAIYDFICENVAYDYDHLEDESYKLKHTAYAALMDGISVCQGYASLFYLMAGKAGLSTRVIAGMGNGEKHGWNIVGLEGNYYYNVDATWDSSRDPYEYFLKSDSDFPGHTRGLEEAKIDYASDEFYAAYPMAEASYDPSLIVLDIPAAVKSLVYSGFGQTGVPEGEGYKLSGTTTATDVGSYTATATPQDGYVWADRTREPVMIEWSIAPADIAASSIAVISAQAYTGSVIEPTLSLSYGGVALVEGADYTVAYANNVNPGLATATVSGIGNFIGSADVSFEIVTMEDRWEKDPRGWKYRNADGTCSADCWQEIGGKRYHFDANGYMQTGWLKENGAWYYLKTSGAMAYSEWVKVSGVWYHFADDGVMQTGWLQEDGYWYYLKASGAMAASEWEEVDGAWYHFAASGAMQTGWLKSGGSWYWLKSGGKMAHSEWEGIDGAWYYFDGSGVMEASKWIGNYYVLANGKMATSQWVGKYYVGADGKWVPELRKMGIT